MAEITVTITSGEITVVNMARGYSGYSGRSGFSGFSGANPGASGYSGYSGKSGFSGISGKSGYSGAGTSGFSGYSGRSAYSGYSAYSGFSGISGFSGYSGTVGLTSYLATTATFNNNDTLANTALSVTVASSGIYGIELNIHSTNVVRSLKLDFGGTASVTNFIGEWESYNAAASSPSAWETAGVSAAGTDYENAALDSGVAGFYKFRGSIEVNNGGTFILRGAQRAADASNTTILRGSTLVLTRIS